MVPLAGLRLGLSAERKAAVGDSPATAVRHGNEVGVLVIDARGSAHARVLGGASAAACPPDFMKLLDGPCR